MTYLRLYFLDTFQEKGEMESVCVKRRMEERSHSSRVLGVVERMNLCNGAGVSGMVWSVLSRSGL